MVFDQELDRDFQLIDYKHIREHSPLLRSITLWPKPKHNATLCI
jgi:hypothetical protein